MAAGLLGDRTLTQITSHATSVSNAQILNQQTRIFGQFDPESVWNTQLTYNYILVKLSEMDDT